MNAEIDTYEMPMHGWTCFHCGETFKTPGGARDHFGSEPLAEPGCKIKAGEERGLLMALRRAEAELDEVQILVEALISEVRKVCRAQMGDMREDKAFMLTVTTASMAEVERLAIGYKDRHFQEWQKS